MLLAHTFGYVNVRQKSRERHDTTYAKDILLLNVHIYTRTYILAFIYTYEHAHTDIYT